MSENESLAEMESIALEAGATNARIIHVEDVVIDERVRLKCFVPRCIGYGRYLMCPPHTMSVDEFKEILKHYRDAVIIQVEAEQDSLDKSGDLTDIEFFDEQMRTLRDSRLKLNDVIDEVERQAFKKGYPYAAGFSSGRCELWGGEECPGISDGICKHPFRARPAMEAVGIDVTRTAEKVGLSLELSSASRVKFTGLVLID